MASGAAAAAERRPFGLPAGLVFDSSLLSKLMLCPDGPLPKKYLEPMKEALLRAEINTPLRAAMFFAQIGHECNSLRWMSELADGSAYDITTNPKLAQRLGNTAPGDGKKYKGRGMIQLTGKDNYSAFGIWLGVGDLFVQNPELVAADPRYAALTAAYYWLSRRQLYVIVDVDDRKLVPVMVKKQGALEKVHLPNVLVMATRVINGGSNGIEDRYRRWQAAEKILGI